MSVLIIKCIYFPETLQFDWTEDKRFTMCEGIWENYLMFNVLTSNEDIVGYVCEFLFHMHATVWSRTTSGVSFRLLSDLFVVPHCICQLPRVLSQHGTTGITGMCYLLHPDLQTFWGSEHRSWQLCGKPFICWTIPVVQSTWILFTHSYGKCFSE